MNDASLKDFQYQQFAFTQAIRQPQSETGQDSNHDQRIKVYQELVFNNLASILKQAFPVLSTLITPQQWQQLIYDFLQQHRAQTPLYQEIPLEFLNFLQQHKLILQHYPFALELAHYEWVELALEIDNTYIDTTQFNNKGDPLINDLKISPLAWALAYQYPVHQISKDYQPQSTPAEPTYLIVHRDLKDTVHFTLINALSAHLFQQIANESGTGKAHIEKLATIHPQLHQQQQLLDCQLLLQQWLTQEIIFINYGHDI